jgi:hypothetical protein
MDMSWLIEKVRPTGPFRVVGRAEAWTWLAHISVWWEEMMGVSKVGALNPCLHVPLWRAHIESVTLNFVEVDVALSALIFFV